MLKNTVEAKDFFPQNPVSEQNPLTISVEARLEYIPIRAFLAILRIAYLAIFKQFGYAYIDSPAIGVIRKFVLNYEEAPLDVGRLILRNVSPVPTDALQFVRISNTGILVVMRLVDDAAQHSYATIMPDPKLNPDIVFETLCRACFNLHKRPRPSA